MSYATIEKQIKAVPAEYLDEISEYIDYILFKANNKKAMNGIKFLADTNAILYFLSGNRCMETFIFCNFAVSIISEMGLLSYSKMTSDEETKIQG